VFFYPKGLCVAKLQHFFQKPALHIHT
jgi:hypothetical protein